MHVTYSEGKRMCLLDSMILTIQPQRPMGFVLIYDPWATEEVTPHPLLQLRQEKNSTSLLLRIIFLQKELLCMYCSISRLFYMYICIHVEEHSDIQYREEEGKLESASGAQIIRAVRYFFFKNPSGCVKNQINLICVGARFNLPIWMKIEKLDWTRTHIYRIELIFLKSSLGFFFL